MSRKIDLTVFGIRVGSVIGCVSEKSNAVHTSEARKIRTGKIHGTPVVPHCHVMLSPSVTYLKVWVFRMLE